MANEAASREANADPLLGALVALAEKLTFSIGVTLWAGGAVVSGTLVDFQTYLDGVVGNLENGSGDGAQMFSEAFELAIDQARAEMPPPRSIESDDPALPTWIHLADVHWMMGASLAPAHDGVFWRARLASVDGWTFGTASTRPRS